MKNWIRKSLVVLFTLATFGLVAPPSALTVNKQAPDANYAPEAEEKKLLLHRDSQDQSAIEQPNIVDQFLFEAEKQSFEKFGKKISGVIEDEFRNLVLPQMEEVIKTFLETEKEKFADLAISQKPANGKGEKIFHIYDRMSGKDLIRFHVRVIIRQNKAIGLIFITIHTMTTFKPIMHWGKFIGTQTHLQIGCSKGSD